jgi:hypothetical protein
MLKRQDDQRSQRSGDEIRPVRAGVTVLPLHTYQSLGFSAFVVGLVTMTQAPRATLCSLSAMSGGACNRSSACVRHGWLHCWFVKTMARVT